MTAQEKLAALRANLAKASNTPQTARNNGIAPTGKLTSNANLPELPFTETVTTPDPQPLAPVSRPLPPAPRNPTKWTKRGRVLSVLNDEVRSTPVGVVGSPSDTNEITLDILEVAETERVRGQMVYLVLPHDNDRRVVVLGQIVNVETKNRWHEDMAFRGIIKRQGNLPHLSDRADVRTATLTVQAAFAIDLDDIGEECCEEDMLGTSPGTGARVYRVRDEVLDALLVKYRPDLVYLGQVYGTQVKMPFRLRHFGREAGGAGEAYHIGVFGKTGSGKSVLAAYLLLAYARHPRMGLLFIDPQGQFSNDQGFPFKLHHSLKQLGRRVDVYRLATQVRLRSSLPAFTELLRKAQFYRDLGIRTADNVEIASEVVKITVANLLHATNAKLETAPPDLMRQTLEKLADDANAIGKIYNGKERRQQLVDQIRTVLANPAEFDELHTKWQAALDLFQEVDSRGNARTSLWQILSAVIRTDPNHVQPVVFLDISGGGTAFKDDEEIKAMLLKEIADVLSIEGEKAFQSGSDSLNCLVALDEAHRYVRAFSRSGDDSEMAQLTRSFVDAVRTTRKYGLGYMFITQTIASLHKEIIGQLRLCAFGYGLTMGSEMAQLEDFVGDKVALSLYRSFVDPQARRQYPFMFTGPVSPLSFTGTPLFVQMFTDFQTFREANGGWAGVLTHPTSTTIAPPAYVTTPGFGSKEELARAKSADFD